MGCTAYSGEIETMYGLLAVTKPVACAEAAPAASNAPATRPRLVSVWGRAIFFIDILLDVGLPLDAKLPAFSWSSITNTCSTRCETCVKLRPQPVARLKQLGRAAHGGGCAAVF